MACSRDFSVVSSFSYPLNGIASVPGDKSISHRAIILGALAIGETRVYGLLESTDVICTINAVKCLGAEVEKNADGSWSILGVGVGGFSEPSKVIDCGNSGTCVRLIMGAMATSPITASFSGDRSLISRPMKRVLKPLEFFGASSLSRGDGFLPLTLMGTGDPIAVNYSSPIASAQVKSAVILAALNAPGVTTFYEPQASRDHTERMLTAFGASITSNNEGSGRSIECNGYAELEAQEVVVPSDPSSAAFPICAALIVDQSEIKVCDVCQNDTRNGLMVTLEEMGAKLEIKNKRNFHGEIVADVVVKSSHLRGVDVPAERVVSMIDEYPILAAVSAVADGKTIMRGLGELRVKESDRLHSMAQGLKANGVKVEEGEDFLTVYGRGPNSVSGGATIHSHYDHRIAMAFLCLGLVSQLPITVDDCSSIETSFPEFINIMRNLGANFQLNKQG